MINVTEVGAKRCMCPMCRAKVRELLNIGKTDAALLYAVLLMTADEANQVTATDEEVMEFLKRNDFVVEKFLEVCLNEPLTH